MTTKNTPFRIPVDIRNKTVDFYNRQSDETKAIIDGLNTTNNQPYAVLLYTFNEFESVTKKERKPRAMGDKIVVTVNDMMTENQRVFTDNNMTVDDCANKQGAWYQLKAITVSSIKQVSSAHNPQSVRTWLNQNEDLITKHHTDMGITDIANHNRLAGKHIAHCKKD